MTVKLIPYGRQDISRDDVAAVVEALTSDYLTQGPTVPRFEEALAMRSGSQHAIAFNSATSALHVACLALGVGPGDEVWTSPVSFVASANCALYCGASVDFVDIDLDTFNMSVDKLGEKLESAQRRGKLPKVIIPVHLCGLPSDMRPIRRLAREYGVRVIEDASHAIGATYEGRQIGSCEYSDITVFSFHPVKIITTAEGGAATVNDVELANRMRLLRSHGITRDPALMKEPSHGSWYYEQLALGFNYRLTDIQAALGISQLRRLDSFLEARQHLAAKYISSLSNLGLSVQSVPNNRTSAYHLFVILLADSVSSADHAQTFERLRARGIGVNLHYMPIYRQPYYRKLGFTAGYCAASEAYYRRAVSIPMFATLTNAEHQTVVDAIKAETA